jgi:N-acetylmuramoyl-L-alanine amidase
VKTSETPEIPKTEVKSGVVYKVQILASPNKLPEKSALLKGYEAVYYFDKNLYKYTYGESTNWAEINSILKKVTKDFKDAFVVKFENGVRIN